MPALHPYPPGPWLRSVFYFSNDEKEWQNIVWFNVSGSPIIPWDPSAAAVDIDTAFAGLFVACLTASAHYLGNTTYYNNGAFTISGETVLSTAGSASGTALPTEDAAVVRLQTGLGGPGGRGRIFVGGVPDSFVTLSRVNTTGAAAYNPLASALIASHTVQGLATQTALLSRKYSGLVQVRTVQCEAVLGHRRKRRPIR